MEKAELGEIFEIIRNGANIKQDSEKSGIPITRIETIATGIIDKERMGYADIFDDRYNEYYLKENDILMSHINSLKHLGKVAICNENMKVIHGMNLLCLRVRKGISAKYLYYFFKSNIFKCKLNKIAKQSVNQSSFCINDLKRIGVKLPILSEQTKIISKLDKVQEIIGIRKEQIKQLEELVKSRFVEMFGEYPQNEKGWNEGTIRDIVNDVRYGSSRPAVEGGKYPYLRMNNITYSGELDLSDVKQIDVPENELIKCSVARGDVLFNRTNSKELVGKTCVYNRDEMMVLAGFVVRVRVNTELAIPDFLSTFMNMDFTKKKLFSMAKAASGQANINAQELQSMGIYIPPVALQKEFMLFKEQIGKLKFTYEKNLKEMQDLMQDLMNKYFE